MIQDNKFQDFVCLLEKSMRLRLMLILLVVLPFFILMTGALFDKLLNRHNPFIGTSYPVAKVFAVLAVCAFLACLRQVVLACRKARA